MTLSTYIAHQLRSLANLFATQAPPDSERMRRFMAAGKAATDTATTDKATDKAAAPGAYWPDATDPLALKHGKEKCDDLERKLFAMTVVAWMAHADHNAKVAAADVISRRVPGFADIFLAATQEAIDFTKTLQEHINQEVESRQAAASAGQEQGASHAQ